MLAISLESSLGGVRFELVDVYRISMLGGLIESHFTTGQFENCNG